MDNRRCEGTRKLPNPISFGSFPFVVFHGLGLFLKKIYLPQSLNLFVIHLSYVVLPLTFMTFVRPYSVKPAIIPEADKAGVMNGLGNGIKAVLTKTGVALTAIPKSMQ